MILVWLHQINHLILIFTRKKNEDDCQLASVFISDDKIKFFNYYKDLPNDCLDFNIVLEEFYSRDNIMKLIY